MNNYLALLILLSYFIVTGILGIIINSKTKLNAEIKRKLLHCFGFLSYPIFLFAFEDWQFAAVIALIIGVGSFILITILEKYKPEFLLFFQERREKEIKYTIFIVFVIFVASLIISVGCLSTSVIGLLAIFGWGFGDLAAALVGTYFGKHHYNLNIINKKSIEGSIACLITIAISSIIILFSYSYSPLISIFFGIGIGIMGAIVELFSINGLDTFLMPTGILFFSLIIYLL